eukprot:TRINITY_DN4045_c0_g4_i1.p1 TRINITY_DN4045_c0_g4~~TRINITY_DN4045_c0_g4_i1.p1  ORF type:complete len:114 (-),score=38.42 TRINITY_DN4045_c0_g4_i1:28-369(-)
MGFGNNKDFKSLMEIQLNIPRHLEKMVEWIRVGVKQGEVVTLEDIWNAREVKDVKEVKEKKESKSNAKRVRWSVDGDENGNEEKEKEEAVDEDWEEMVHLVRILCFNGYLNKA